VLRTQLQGEVIDVTIGLLRSTAFYTITQTSLHPTLCIYTILV
jgi:hypothetical protein